ncbi:Lrp/AsnC family transcriptional regulator [Halalkalicoccus tibetensis]|uniref:siroheme decarboxylase n=1 Tax=Halalkalicoccus tibetensis TaxID=175632 RepID=A0ABD5V8F7_9EURY
MRTLEDDWRADLDDVDAALIDGYQSGVPVEPRPFRAIGEAVGVSEDEALARVEALSERGIVRRFGAVLNPPVIGSSTLAAVKAPEERFEEVAAVINSYRQVNHNYRRDHEWNTWFVVTAGSRETRDRILTEIEERTGCTVLNLPMLTDFYIDLEFPVVNADRFARESSSEAGRVEATTISEEATGELSELDAAVLLGIQNGLPLSLTPYADVARAIGRGTDEVIDSVSRLLENGCIKRIGCVINHVVTGFDANCMVVWDIPDHELDERGRAVGALPYVTLCYHRPRREELGWGYNLFTMIHGREPEAVDARIDELAGEHLPFDHERLYSTETLKQTGARYDELLGSAAGE